MVVVDVVVALSYLKNQMPPFNSKNVETTTTTTTTTIKWHLRTMKITPESILPNFDFFVFPIFAFKLGHFKVQTILS